MVNKREPEYSVDWFSENISTWKTLLDQYGMKGKDNLRFLEIGRFEGRATNFLLENIEMFTDIQNAYATVIITKK